MCKKYWGGSINFFLKNHVNIRHLQAIIYTSNKAIKKHLKLSVQDQNSFIKAFNNESWLTMWFFSFYIGQSNFEHVVRDLGGQGTCSQGPQLSPMGFFFFFWIVTGQDPFPSLLFCLSRRVTVGDGAVWQSFLSIFSSRVKQESITFLGFIWIEEE